MFLKCFRKSRCETSSTDDGDIVENVFETFFKNLSSNIFNLYLIHVKKMFFFKKIYVMKYFYYLNHRRNLRISS